MNLRPSDGCKLQLMIPTLCPMYQLIPENVTVFMTSFCIIDQVLNESHYFSFASASVRRQNRRKIGNETHSYEFKSFCRFV